MYSYYLWSKTLKTIQIPKMLLSTILKEQIHKTHLISRANYLKEVTKNPQIYEHQYQQQKIKKTQMRKWIN
jgi:hypothetical protein